jgi:DNA-binding response OmpR family regulator
MKDIIIVAGGDSGRRLRLRNNLELEQFEITECRSLLDFTIIIGQRRIAAVLLLYPDECGTVRELLKHDSISIVTGNASVIFVSSSSVENTRLRSLHYNADEFLIEPISPDNINNIILENINSN